MPQPKGPMWDIHSTEFRSMQGAVMHLTDVRPDIASAVSRISQRQCNPRAITYLIYYLYVAMSTGVVYAEVTQHPQQYLYADCGFACHVDMSICEGEIGAAVELTCDTILIKDILREPYQEQMKPTPVYDDAAAITWRPAWTAITNMSAACVPRSTG